MMQRTSARRISFSSNRPGGPGPAILGCLVAVMVIGIDRPVDAQPQAVSFDDIDLTYHLPPDARYDRNIPTPAEYFGFEVGTRHVYNHEVVGYMRALAEASDRVAIEEYAQTHSGKPLIVLTITSPRNHERLDEIRQRHIALSDPARSEEINIEREPIVVWMCYGVHGNEPSATNAAPLVAYHLAASRDRRVQNLLNNAVILIDPVLNPEGLDRFAHHANSFRGDVVNADPEHREHNERWPGGRTNYYFFDLNRDWMPAVHPESRGRLRIFHRWKPNILNDYHEMGTDSTYFFQPGVPSRTNPLIPQENIALTREIAVFHAEGLDEVGTAYFTQERFDDFYIGKGSTYPDLHGAVGILYEQASARGHAQESMHGLLTFPMAIRNQVRTSLSTFDAALDLRTRLLEHQRTFHREALRKGQTAGFAGYVFTAANDPARVNRFVQLLRLHDIGVFPLTQPLDVDGRSYASGQSYFVPAAQPEFIFVQALFESRTEFEENIFYDISAWTMPLAYGLAHDAVPLDAEVSVDWLGVTLTRREAKPALDRSEIAYLIDWRTADAPRIVHQFLADDVTAYVAMKPFESETTVGRVSFNPGTVLLRIGHQAEKHDRVYEVLSAAMERGEIRAYAATSGLSLTGIDLGSGSFSPIDTPHVLLLSGDGTSANGVGEVWHLFDRHLRMPISMVDGDRLASVDLNDYTAVILTAGSHSGITERGRTNLKEWVERGGTVIALETATRFCRTAQLADAAPKRRARSGGSDDGDGDDAPDLEGTPRRDFAEAEHDRMVHAIAGTILKGDVDPTHPVGFGYDARETALFLTRAEVLSQPASPYATPVAITEDPLLSGYASPENLAAFSGGAAVSVESRGRGRVVLFAINPVFRGHWHGTERLLVNSVFFGSSITVPRGGGDSEEQ